MARETGRVICKLDDMKGRVVYVLRDDHWDEYRCELWINGEHQEPADYHTDDRKDAFQTAERMICQ